MQHHRLRPPTHAVLSALLAGALAAQRPAPSVESAPTPAPIAEKHFVQLRYPRDKEAIVAMVGGMPIHLEDVVERIDSRHYPGFRDLLAGPEGKGSPDGARILSSDLIAPWVRQLADIRALRATAERRAKEGGEEIDEAKLEALMSSALKAGFENYLASYTADLQRRNIDARMDQNRVNLLLADYQMRHGLSSELQGWLDYLEPARDWSKEEVTEFYRRHTRIFGGGVTTAHILVQNRDAGTGIMLDAEGLARANARLVEIRSRLQRDGSNFEEIARLFSEDTRTAPDGGVLEGVERFDYRLPAAICRTAWQLKDGEVSGIVETQYGWHFVKRVAHEQYRLMTLATDNEIFQSTVRNAMVRMLQEDLLFGAREQMGVELKL